MVDSDIIDINAIVPRLLPAISGDLRKTLEAGLTTALIVFMRRQSAKTQSLTKGGLEASVHNTVYAAFESRILADRIAAGLGAIVRIALLPQMRENILREVKSPQLNRAQLEILIRKHVSEKAGVFVFEPVKQLLRRRGRVGQVISGILGQAFPASRVGDAVWLAIERVI